FSRDWSSDVCSCDLGIRGVYYRRNSIEKKYGIELPTTTEKSKTAIKIKSFEQRRHVGVHDGIVIVFSDAHYWPGPPSIAHLALQIGRASCRDRHVAQ